jgi:hypothetical protein
MRTYTKIGLPHHATVNNAEEIKNSMAVSFARNRQRLGSQFDELFSIESGRGQLQTSQVIPVFPRLQPRPDSIDSHCSHSSRCSLRHPETDHAGHRFSSARIL